MSPRLAAVQVRVWGAGRMTHPDQAVGVAFLRRTSTTPPPINTTATTTTTTTIVPVLLESSLAAAAAAVEAGATTTPTSAVPVAAVVDSSASGTGVRSADVGGPSVTLRVGAGNSGSGAPSAAISIQSSSPFSQVSMAGKWRSPA